MDVMLSGGSAPSFATEPEILRFAGAEFILSEAEGLRMTKRKSSLELV
jgi:hypothetical protein